MATSQCRTSRSETASGQAQPSAFGWVFVYFETELAWFFADEDITSFHTIPDSYALFRCPTCPKCPRPCWHYTGCIEGGKWSGRLANWNPLADMILPRPPHPWMLWGCSVPNFSTQSSSGSLQRWWPSCMPNWRPCRWCCSAPCS